MVKIILYEAPKAGIAEYIKFEKMNEPEKYWWAYQTKDGGTSNKPYGILNRIQLVELVTQLQQLLLEN